jgi:hypothetical protein
VSEQPTTIALHAVRQRTTPRGSCASATRRHRSERQPRGAAVDFRSWAESAAQHLLWHHALRRRDVSGIRLRSGGFFVLTKSTTSCRVYRSASGPPIRTYDSPSTDSRMSLASAIVFDSHAIASKTIGSPSDHHVVNEAEGEDRRILPLRRKPPADTRADEPGVNNALLLTCSRQPWRAGSDSAARKMREPAPFAAWDRPDGGFRRMTSQAPS